MMRCALIGCGRAAREFDLPALRAIPEVRVAALCDEKAEAMRSLASRLPAGVSQYPSVDVLLDKEKGLDFALVATPGFTHFEVCRKVIAAGLHLLVEKPLALNLEDCRTLQAAAAAQSVRVGVIHNYRFMDSILRARRALDRGLVGEVLQVNVTYHGESLFQEAEWLHDERKSKALLYELGIHYLDFPVYFAGPVKEIRGIHALHDPHLNCTTRLHALLGHVSGAASVVDIQLFASSNFSQVEVYGSANDLLIKLFPDSCRVYSGHVSALDEAGEGLRRLGAAAWTLTRDTFFRPAVQSRALPHWRFFREFVRSLQDPSVPSPVPVEAVLPTMELLEQLSTHVYGPQPAG